MSLFNRRASRRRALELRFMIRHARSIWQYHLRGSVRHWGVETAPNLRTITLINDPWHFDERAWEFDLDRMKREIRPILAGCNYVVAIEFACFCKSSGRHWSRPDHRPAC
jgi:hypothetical protein